MTQDSRPRSRQRVSDRAEAEILALIEKRGLKPGARLPSERALSDMLGASRTSLREAIGRLATRGVVEVRKTGLVVAQPQPDNWVQATISAPLAALVTTQTGYGHDVMEIRHALEGAAAYYAALRADDAARARIRTRLEAMQASHGGASPMDEARLDADFHLAIAEASNNAVLYQVMSSLFGLLQSSISESLEKLYLVPQTFEALSRQHQALYQAIAAGDADRARDASDAHLRFVETTIRQIDADLARKARASAARAAGQMKP
ncbi:FCD domain-containing protein [Paracoccus jiaweipingae]|uniref:FCD domain-containing protein n=1 Tax=unclassified Paracoccus (in: a-proteobacteria) TaxID=2688777 RepID=UPI0037A9E654